MKAFSFFLSLLIIGTVALAALVAFPKSSIDQNIDQKDSLNVKTEKPGNTFITYIENEMSGKIAVQVKLPKEARYDFGAPIVVHVPTFFTQNEDDFPGVDQLTEQGFIEVTLMPGKGSLLLTGQLGDVMKESGQAAMSYVRSNYANLGLPEKFFHKVDVHVHVPEGAIPKDGPSAGISLTTAIVSAFTKIPVHKEVAMTGEVTLRGRVLEIGGFKEKILAAHRAGVKTIIAPQDNEKDLEDIPQNVLKDLQFHYVDHVDQVLKVALKGK